MKLICYFTFLVIVNSLKKKTQKKNPHKLVKKEKKKSNENYEIDQITINLIIVLMFVVCYK